jgi:hypothetical protein
MLIQVKSLKIYQQRHTRQIKKSGQAGESTGSIASSNRSFRTFQEEKEFVQSLKHFPVK